MTNPKLLIIGHGRHGKDTVAEYLRDDFGYNFKSSSEFVGEETIWDNWGCAVYPSFKKMYDDRANHRQLWYELICAYNTPDKAKTGRTMIERGYDLYVGMRARDEYEACMDQKVFDHVVWVERPGFEPEPSTSMDLIHSDADFIIINNGTLQDLRGSVAAFMGGIA